MLRRSNCPCGPKGAEMTADDIKRKIRNFPAATLQERISR